MTVDQKLVFSATVLALLHVPVLGAVFFAPYGPATQHRDFPFVPPMRLHFVDPHGGLHARPFICLWTNDQGSSPPRYHEDCGRTFPLRFAVRERTENTTPSWRLFGVDAPAHIFLLGTDDYGRDQLSRLLHGSQISLFAGLFAAGLALGLGLLLGSISGYFSSWVDDLIMGGVEVFMALPWIYLLFAVRAFLPLHLDVRASFLLLVSIIGFTGWARPARLIRGVVLSAKERDYVLAARGFGGSTFYILRNHVLPETYAVVMTQAALLVPQYILAEVTLSFLGLGVGEPAPSLGNMLADLQRYYVLSNYWWMFAPGLMLVAIFLLYYSLADAVQAKLKTPGFSNTENPARTPATI